MWLNKRADANMLENQNPWPDKYIEQRIPSPANVSDLERILKDARDEAPLQTFLASTPVLLKSLTLSVRDVWCFDRPSFGGELIPDFLLAGRLSSGIHWMYVELESPNASPLNKSGRPSGKLNVAVAQVREWRIWLRENVAYAQMHLGLNSLDAECSAVILIGRRSMIPSKHVLKYRELSRQTITVMTYDRLLESARTLALEGLRDE